MIEISYSVCRNIYAGCGMGALVTVLAGMVSSGRRVFLLLDFVFLGEQLNVNKKNRSALRMLLNVLQGGAGYWLKPFRCFQSSPTNLLLFGQFVALMAVVFERV